MIYNREAKAVVSKILRKHFKRASDKKIDEATTKIVASLNYLFLLDRPIRRGNGDAK